MTQERPIGQTYSSLYLEKKSPEIDSQRFRTRLGYYLDSELPYDSEIKYEIAKLIKLRTGIQVNSSSNGYSRTYYFEKFIKALSLEDMLDIITLLYRILPRQLKRAYLDFVALALQQENLAYIVDEKCGVHPLIDSEYQKDKQVTIRGLEASRFESAYVAFQKSNDFLTATQPDFKNAIKSVFECAEVVFKTTFGTQNLAKHPIQRVMQPDLENIYSRDPTALIVAKRLSEALINWVDACHNYRHGQSEGLQAPQPPNDIAITLISTGSSMIRWLLDIDLHRSNQ